MAREEDVTFERLTRVYRDESQKKTLSPLEPDFYDKVSRYVARLESEAEAARAKDANSKAALLLQDELRKARQKREQICQYRERKIGLLASQRAAGESVDTRGLARPEADLLERLTQVLTDHRITALGTAAVAGKPSAIESTPPTRSPDRGPPPKEPPSTSPVTAGVLVRILEDLPPFAGPEGTLRLSKEDLVTLPPSLAKVLTERGVARVVAPSPSR